MTRAQALTLSGELRLRPDRLGSKNVPTGVAERRRKPRIYEPFPTRAWGTDADGEVFEVDCELNNISSSGLHLCAGKQMKVGADLSVVIKFMNGDDAGATALLLCQVLRDELQGDGGHGLAIAVKEHHFL